MALRNGYAGVLELYRRSGRRRDNMRLLDEVGHYVFGVEFERTERFT